MESIHVVSKDEDTSENPVAVEGCAISVDIRGNEVPIAVDVVVAVLITESSVPPFLCPYIHPSGVGWA